MVWIVSTLPLAIAVWGLLIHNRFVRLRNLVRNGWADIDVQLQRRHDLVPQLVEIVRGYAAHERAALELVTELRTRALNTPRPEALAGVEAELESGLGRLLALREAYPDLKADANFRQLHQSLQEVEEHLQFARRFYNGAVRDFNTAIQKIPDLLVARTFRFVDAEHFHAAAESRGAVAVALQ